ncbi:solute-binding protein [Devosia pacifica]|uniref:Solute-binding protein n=1 Tax=Devosia pacifica TaxID=1335967 RepID=A0A918S4N3_9HYPH|nr:ABC transporter substrate-binding protein [Devosia pacifica]GHA23842.1 solute-binding protein [Devosia pacifica]
MLVASDAVAKSELVLAVGGEPETGYDPLLGWGRYGHPLFQSTLLKRGPDLETVPDLAADWSLSSDRLTWTITIRPGVTFSDGSALTADDVAFTFNRAAETAGARDLSAMVDATAIDAETVEITLKRPWITFSETFYSLGIVPSDRYGPDYARQPTGSGPYTLVSWTEGEQLIVEANPGYYGEHPQFERLTFLFTSEDTSLAAALAGQVDVVSVPAPMADLEPAGFKTIVATSVDNRGITFPMREPGETNAEGEPVGNAVTSDIAIRRAINLAIDREELVAVALLGHGRPAYGPADGLPWSAPDASLAQDLGAGREMLDAAGWREGPDGVRVRDDVRAAMNLNYPASDLTRQALAVTTAQQLEAIGLDVTAKGLSWDRIERVMHSEPVLFGWGSHSPEEVYSLYQSDWGGVDYYNPGYFSNPAVDEYFAEAQAAVSLEASYPYWQAAEWDGDTGFGAKGDAGWAWLVNLDHVYFVNECLDLGPLQTEPHGHGWPVTAMIEQWQWTCE